MKKTLLYERTIHHRIHQLYPKSTILMEKICDINFTSPPELPLGFDWVAKLGKTQHADIIPSRREWNFGLEDDNG